MEEHMVNFGALVINFLGNSATESCSCCQDNKQAKIFWVCMGLFKLQKQMQQLQTATNIARPTSPLLFSWFKHVSPRPILTCESLINNTTFFYNKRAYFVAAVLIFVVDKISLLATFSLEVHPSAVHDKDSTTVMRGKPCHCQKEQADVRVDNLIICC